MKRFRIRAIGWGLALAAGTGAAAANASWNAQNQPAPPEVVPAGAPALLPPSMRAAPKKADPGPVWLPAEQTPQPLVVHAGAGVPAPDLTPQPTPATEGSFAFGPRGVGAPGPLPAIPALPDAAAQPTSPPVVWSQPNPLPQPKPTDPKPADPKPADPKPVDPKPPVMLPPHAPDFLPPMKKDGDPLPAPRPVDPQPLPVPRPESDLPPAPAELMYPAGALTVTKHGTFGSPPLRLSHDYPPLRDLIQKGHHHDGISILDDGMGDGAFDRFFVRGEYLLWWMPGFATPVLATTNPNTALNGYLGEPGTTAIIGPGPFIEGTRSGLRVRAGAWLDDCGSCGLDAGFFILPTRSASSVVTSDRFPLITRPVFVPNLIPGTNTPLGENGEAVAVPGTLRGSLAVRGDSQLWGADVNARKSLCGTCGVHAEVFAGYRHLNLRESLTMTEDITVIGAGGSRINITDPVGTRVVVQDRFRTHNYFHGGQIGALYERHFGRWVVDARGSLALGATHQVLEIDGFQVRQRPGAAPMNFRGGLLAAGPNLGRFTRDRFSVAPELTLNVGYHVTPGLRVFAGYNFLLWTNVIRPGDQIDHTVDLTFVPNALPAGFSGQYRPRPLFRERDLVVQGFQLGVDWRW